MSLILQIQEIVSGPIKDLFLEITGPFFTVPAAPALPPVDLQVGPDTVGDVDFGSSFGDQAFGSSFGDQNLGSTAGDIPVGSTFGDISPSLGSSNGDQNISGLSVPGSAA